ncbi:hypothetical protein HY639_03035 [Candidatus Woesearchaeota archaeon]|nr:hypothetical protein [Candidatus Woesearchaeota archaeon]
MYDLLQQYFGSKPIGYHFFERGNSYLGRGHTIDMVTSYAAPARYDVVSQSAEKVAPYEPRRALTTSYAVSHDVFLKKDRPPTQFIGDAAEIQHLIEEAFLTTAGQPLPKDIVIRLCTKEELARIHSQFGTWDESIQGFALNRKHQGSFSEIFVKRDFLDRTMLTLGHELGHVFTSPLPNAHDEEAKAFAFELAWMAAVRDQNIGNLRTCIIDVHPAENGLHNTAFAFVISWMQQGMDALAIYWDLARRNLSMKLDELIQTRYHSSSASLRMEHTAQQHNMAKFGCRGIYV